jgi:NADH:ubiquinone oxidoreductase subunit K
MVLCALGVLLPYWQIAPWLSEHGLDLSLFFRQLFESRVGAFFGMDVFVSAAALLVFARSERKRTGARAVWLVALAVAAVGVSLGLPLFLYLRERSPERGGRAHG